MHSTMSYSPPSGQWPSYPSYQPYPAYQPYQPYPYQPYQPAPPAPEVQPDEGPLPEPPQGVAPGRYAGIFAIVLGVVCLAALVLAALAPTLSPRAATNVPTTWAKVYDDVIRTGSAWDTSGDCTPVSGNLDIQASDTSVSCNFKPSESLDVLSQGFYIQAEVAPAARVAGVQLPMITVGEGQDIKVAFDQEGNYRLCAGAGSNVCLSDSTIAWHSDGYVPNTIGLLYIPGASTSDSGTVTFFANGQEIASKPDTLPSNAPLALGAATGGEALFTHVTLYLASAR